MAIQVEYGKCAQCGDNNVKTAAACRRCAAPLPWSKTASAAPEKLQASPGRSISSGASEIAWGAMTMQIFGGILFLLGVFLFVGNISGQFPTFPGLGYITMVIGGGIWRAA